jgi:selenocysteine lyase/cysteine desulfurase
LSAGVTVVGFDGLDLRKISESLYTQHHIAMATTGGLRFSPHIYNTLEEIERTMAALNQVIRSLG